jgi:hypothetical protein
MTNESDSTNDVTCKYSNKNLVKEESILTNKIDLSRQIDPTEESTLIPEQSAMEMSACHGLTQV